MSLRMKQTNRADYDYEFVSGVHTIIDLDQGSKSVTNDIENVVRDIGAKPGDLIIYRDSSGQWDGVELGSNGDCHFYSLGSKSLASALSLVKARGPKINPAI